MTITNRTFKIAAVAPENMLYEANATTMRLDDLRFVAERILLTRSELLERGISKRKVMDLPAYEADVKIDSTARNRRYDPNNSAETADQDLIECYECYLLIDMNGDGISEHNRAKVFDSFFTTRRDKGGTGMGLGIAQTILHAHGGAIRLLPSRKGAAFELRLPKGA